MGKWPSTDGGDPNELEFGVNWPSSCGMSPCARFHEPLPLLWAVPLCLDGQITMTLHIFKPKDCSNKFDWEWMGPVVVEFQRPQYSRGSSDKQTDNSIVHFFHVLSFLDVDLDSSTWQLVRVPPQWFVVAVVVGTLVVSEWVGCGQCSNCVYCKQTSG